MFAGQYHHSRMVSWTNLTPLAYFGAYINYDCKKFYSKGFRSKCFKSLFCPWRCSQISLSVKQLWPILIFVSLPKAFPSESSMSGQLYGKAVSILRLGRDKYTSFFTFNVVGAKRSKAIQHQHLGPVL